MTAILPLEAGAIVGGHYSIEGLINTGGFGSVYRGTALSEGNRPCAIKETYDVTPAARRQALMEAAILFTVKSEHLPQVYDAFEENGRFYLVMQLIEGQNCAQVVQARGAPCSEEEALGWFLPVVDVLQELHGRNPPVLHRDIKPANIILTPQGKAVLVDFGLTRLYDPGIETQTMARAISEGFSPLEQYVGQTSPQSDIYSLAATMYFVLTARVPPSSVARSMQDTLVPPRQLNPRLSQKVESILLKALAVNAEQRFTSMQEFARALRAPVFVGYADPTVAQTGYRQANAAPGMALASTPFPPLPPSASPSWPKRGQVQVYQGVQSQPARSRRQPSAFVPGGNSAATPVPRPPVLAIPPPAGGSQDRTYPPANVKMYRALPGPFNQGCLWGLLQGVLSALILLALKKDIYFVLGVIEGFVFYFLAGFFTTRLGGSVMRALRAGFWAGVISTISYWIVLVVGLLVEAAPYVQNLTEAARRRGTSALALAINRIKPDIFAGNPPSGSTNGSLLPLLLIGLACAMGCALLGGFVGRRSALKRGL